MREGVASREEIHFSADRALNKMPWRVFRDDMQIVDEDQVKSMVWSAIEWEREETLSVISRITENKVVEYGKFHDQGKGGL